MSKRERTRAALLLLAVFVVGALVGAAADRVLLFRGGQMYPKHGVRAASHRLLDRLDRELALTEVQETQVKEIIDRRASRLDNVWKNVEPAVRGEIERADSEISAVLDAEQRQKFETMKRQWRDRARRVMRKKGPPR